MSGRDPATMGPDARLAELGLLLARGFRRMRQNSLDAGAPTERPCDRAVDALENHEQEVA